MHLRRPFRIAAAFIVAVSATTLLGVCLIYRDASVSSEDRRRAIVADEVAAVMKENPERVREDLRVWLREELRRWSVAALFDAAGRPLMGNLSRIPPQLEIDGRVHRLELPADLVDPRAAPGATDDVLAAGIRRPDGTLLVLGRTMSDVAALRRDVLDVVLWGGAGLLVASMAFAARASLRQANRLDMLRRALARVVDGALGERLPTRGRRGDDLDALARDVNVMLGRLQALVSEVKQVSDNIAHDLRTPLTVVRARLEAALIAEADIEGFRATAAVALTDLDRALASVTALLRLAEIESGQRRAGFEVVDVAALCRDAFDFYLPLAEERGISLSLDAPAPIRVAGDGELLLEAVNNLLDNALKYTDSPGAVELGTWAEGDAVVVSVADSGVGFPVAERENVGRRFFRADGSRHKPGTGLGLSLVSAIAELHGFSLSVGENRPRGSVFALSGVFQDRGEAVLAGVDGAPAGRAGPHGRVAPEEGRRPRDGSAQRGRAHPA